MLELRADAQFRATCPSVSGYINNADIESACEVGHGLLIFLNRAADVLQRFRFRRALRPAAGQTWTGDGVAFFRFLQNDTICHIDFSLARPAIHV